MKDSRDQLKIQAEARLRLPLNLLQERAGLLLRATGAFDRSYYQTLNRFRDVAEQAIQTSTTTVPEQLAPQPSDIAFNATSLGQPDIDPGSVPVDRAVAERAVAQAYLSYTPDMPEELQNAA